MPNRVNYYLLILLLCFSTFAVQSKETIYISSGEWPPFLGQELQQEGLISHIVREAFASVDIDVVYGYFPWKRSYNYAVRGEGAHKDRWHATAVWYYSPKREKELNYSDVVYEADEVLFYLKSNPIKWHEDSDLKGKRIGGTEYSPYPHLESLEDKGIVKIVRSGGDDVQMQRLFHRNVDAVSVIKEVGFYYVAKKLTITDLGQVAFIDNKQYKRYLYLLFSTRLEENERLLKEFNRGLRIIRSNGRYFELLESFRHGYYW